MMSRLFLSYDDIQMSKCNKCSKYLSVPPIIIQSNNSICGRCPQTEEGTRVYFYESLAKYMIFPCVYDINGCTAQVPWEKVLCHEINCKYEEITCPFENCTKIITKKALIKHFRLARHDQLQTNTILCSSMKKNQLYIRKEDIFIIQTLYSNQNVFLRISSLYDHVVKAFNVKLTIKSKKSELVLNKFKITKYNVKYPEFCLTERINIGILRNTPISEISCYIGFEEKIEASKNHIDNGITDNIFSELKCSICFGFMKPPIYVCFTGHSLCGTCKSKLLKCPTCNDQLGDTRNFSLEKIAEAIAKSDDLSKNTA